MCVLEMRLTPITINIFDCLLYSMSYFGKRVNGFPYNTVYIVC